MNASNDESNNPTQNNTNPTENEQRKKGKGRQKITMAKIENETNLQVTFSKRRAGVFKKASELSTLCGAESAVVVFSPGNKPHSFGHPSVEAVANRLLHPAGGEAPAARTNAAERLIMAHSGAAMHQRNQELVAIEAELEREKRRKKELDGLIGAAPQLEGLGYEQLEKLRKSVVGFKREFEAKVKSSGASSNSGCWDGGDGGGSSSYGGNGNGNGNGNVNGNGNGNGNGYGNGNGGGNSSSSFGMPLDASYGYMVQYPGVGFGGYNYGDPAAVVQYDAGTGSSDADADGVREAARADERNKYQGFGTSYRRPHF